MLLDQGTTLFEALYRSFGRSIRTSRPRPVVTRSHKGSRAKWLASVNYETEAAFRNASSRLHQSPMRFHLANVRLAVTLPTGQTTQPERGVRIDHPSSARE